MIYFQMNGLEDQNENRLDTFGIHREQQSDTKMIILYNYQLRPAV